MKARNHSQASLPHLISMRDLCLIAFPVLAYRTKCENRKLTIRLISAHDKEREYLCYSRNTGCSFSDPDSSANLFMGVALSDISAVPRVISAGSYSEIADITFSC